MRLSFQAVFLVIIIILALGCLFLFGFLIFLTKVYSSIRIVFFKFFMLKVLHLKVDYFAIPIFSIKPLFFLATVLIFCYY